MFLTLSPTNSTSGPFKGNSVGTEFSLGTVQVQFLVVLLTFVTITTVFGNTLILLSYYRYSQVRTPSNTIILSLSFVDILLSAVFVMNIMSVVGYPNMGKVRICLLMSSLSDVIRSVMTLHLCLISFERFIAVRNALAFHSIFTLRRVLYALIFVWSLGLFISLGMPRLLVAADHQGHNYSRLRKMLHPCGAKAYLEALIPELNTLAFTSLCLNHIFPFMFIISCYGYIVHVARRHRKQIAAQRRENRLKPEMKGTITAALVVGIFTVCFTPLAILTLHRVTNPKKFSTFYWAKVTHWLYLLANSSGFLNPAVYAWRTEAFRNAFVKILCRPSCRIVQQHITELPRRSHPVT